MVLLPEKTRNTSGLGEKFEEETSAGLLDDPITMLLGPTQEGRCSFFTQNNFNQCVNAEPSAPNQTTEKAMSFALLS